MCMFPLPLCFISICWICFGLHIGVVASSCARGADEKCGCGAIRRSEHSESGCVAGNPVYLTFVCHPSACLLSRFYFIGLDSYIGVVSCSRPRGWNDNPGSQDHKEG